MTHSFIKEAREKKGLTQEFVAKILRISRQTYSKIEKGETEPSFWSAIKLMELLNINLNKFQYRDTTILPSQPVNRKKYKQIIKNCIKFWASRDGMITKTKLAKLCYLVDFARYYNHLEPLTNLHYLKMDQWPVPNEYFTMIDTLQDQESIAITQKDKAYLIENIDEPEHSELSLDELNLIKKICKKRQKATTREIVEFTHNQLPRGMSYPMEEVPYGFITQEDPDNVF